MGLQHDLLEQADHLARRESRKPKQASLRRAVSASYYALFHLFLDEAVLGLVKGPNPDSLRNLLRRAFDHGEMRRVCDAFSGGTLPESLAAVLGGPVSADLRNVADAFLELQQARHEADYNLSRSFTRGEVQDLIAKTRAAFHGWNAVRTTEAARLFLAALLTGERLRRRAS
jgi:uncharacterized protein (UPF0332 family)